MHHLSPHHLVDDLVEALRSAILEKATRADRRVILVLDAIGVPQFALPRVVAAFKHRYADDIEQIGFQEIWLAGPTVERTVRLDSDS